jgi:type II secretory pathway pseudopilin PulG
MRLHIDRCAIVPEAVSNHESSSSFKIKNVPRHLAKEEVKMKTLLRLLLKSQHQRNRSEPAKTEKGMTLVELLVGAIMAFLIITPMLGFVVDMLNTDRREQVKANTEQDIQAAVDFIAQDLSQAIYIYDNNPVTNGTPNTTPTGIPALVAENFLPPIANETPILVFWKRQQLKNSLPINANDIPKDCIAGQFMGSNACNDTYVLALVAYYQVSGSPGIWCQPSGAPCPNQIVRYQIQDGLRNPSDPLQGYFPDAKVSDGQKRSDAFNPAFDLSKPTEKVTTRSAADFQRDRQVLVNYIDHSPKGIDPEECQKALGYPTTQTGNTTPLIPEDTLRVTELGPARNDNPKGFYACVDTARNIARVTIRGNSLRRLQPGNAVYAKEKSAYFPTATVQVQGLGARGK